MFFVLGPALENKQNRREGVDHRPLGSGHQGFTPERETPAASLPGSSGGPSQQERFEDQVDPHGDEEPAGDEPQPILAEALRQSRPDHRAEGHHEDQSEARPQEDRHGGNGGRREDDDGELRLVPERAMVTRLGRAMEGRLLKKPGGLATRDLHG